MGNKALPLGDDFLSDKSGRAFVIFNPASNGGRGAKRIPRYLDLLNKHLPHFDHVVTSEGGGRLRWPRRGFGLVTERSSLWVETEPGVQLLTGS